MKSTLESIGELAVAAYLAGRKVREHPVSRCELSEPEELDYHPAGHVEHHAPGVDPCLDYDNEFLRDDPCDNCRTRFEALPARRRTQRRLREAIIEHLAEA